MTVASPDLPTIAATVCQFHETPDGPEDDWAALRRHVEREQSDLVLLPEMPFAPWLARDRRVDPARWDAAVDSHRRWLDRLDELGGPSVVGSRPRTTAAGERRNEGFVWNPSSGYRAVHEKAYLPDEPGFWEASWYDAGAGAFDVARLGEVEIGLLICSELWLGERAREYGRKGAHVVAVPRATPGETVDKWIAGGRVAAVVSGAWCLSSNRGGVDEHGTVWAGTGWIIEPEAGDVVAVTSEAEPFVTRRLDLGRARTARSTYPRYLENPPNGASV